VPYFNLIPNSSDTAESEDEENSNKTKEKKKKKKQDDMEPPRVKGELTFKDLPPIEDLHISVPHEQAQPIGTVKSFVDPLGNYYCFETVKVSS